MYFIPEIYDCTEIYNQRQIDKKKTIKQSHIHTHTCTFICFYWRYENWINQIGMKLIFFAMIARTFGSWFECNISWTTNATQQNVNIFSFHDITTLTNRCDRFWYFESIQIWCGWYGIWFAITTACIRTYRKLYAIWNLDCSTMTW